MLQALFEFPIHLPSSIAWQLFEASVLSWGRLLLIPVLIAGAVAAYIYVPIVGKFMSIGLVAAAAAIGAYQYGYDARARLDQSIDLQKQLAITKAALDKANADIAFTTQLTADSQAREKLANQTATDLQLKVSDYEKQLSDEADKAGQTDTTPVNGKCPVVHQTNHCLLTDADVNGLRAIRGPGSNRKSRK